MTLGPAEYMHNPWHQKCKAVEYHKQAVEASKDWTFNSSQVHIMGLCCSTEGVANLAAVGCWDAD